MKTAFAVALLVAVVACESHQVAPTAVSRPSSSLAKPAAANMVMVNGEWTDIYDVVDAYVATQDTTLLRVIREYQSHHANR